MYGSSYSSLYAPSPAAAYMANTPSQKVSGQRESSMDDPQLRACMDDIAKFCRGERLNSETPVRSSPPISVNASQFYRASQSIPVMNTSTQPQQNSPPALQQSAAVSYQTPSLGLGPRRSQLQPQHQNIERTFVTENTAPSPPSPTQKVMVEEQPTHRMSSFEHSSPVKLQHSAVAKPQVVETQPVSDAWDPASGQPAPHTSSRAHAKVKHLPEHLQTVYHIASYLKAHFAVDAQEFERGVETLSNEDVLALAQCFYVEVFQLVHEMKHPDTPMQEPYGQIVPLKVPDVQPAQNASHVNAETANKQMVIHQAAPVNPVQPAETKEPPLQNKPLGPGLLNRNNPEAQQQKLKMPLRESLVFLRNGGFLIKYGRNGKPALRFINLQDKKILVEGQEGYLPHFSWSTDVRSAPTQQLCLRNLEGIRYGAESPNFTRDEKGAILGLQSKYVDSKLCFSLTFASRSVELAAQNKEDFQKWVRALEAVIERNLEIAQAEEEDA